MFDLLRRQNDGIARHANMTENSVENGQRSDFSERLIDGFFRRWFLYAIPVVLFAGVGAASAQRITGEYSSYLRMSASTNPYVTTPVVRGTDIAFYETPASGSARLISEQLQTDLFVDDVADRAGLADALENGVITRDQIRSHVSAGAIGTNTLNVDASWDDPDTAFRLVNATISGYSDFLEQVAVADSIEAIAFWNTRLEEAKTETLVAEDALNAYVAQLPQTLDGQRTIEETLAIQRLSSAIDAAQEGVTAAQSALDDATFAETQARSESSRLLRVIDPATVASEQSPVRRDQAIAFASFALLGVVVSCAALLLSTALDRSVRTRSQLALASGSDAVAVIPVVKQLRKRSRQTERRWGRAA